MDMGNDKLNSLVLKVGDHEVMAGDVSLDGLTYLLQYGFRQSVQDVIAGKAKAMQVAVWEKDDPEVLDGSQTAGELRYNVAEINSALYDLQRDRVDAIVSGTIGAPRVGTTRGDILSRTMTAVAVERLKGKLAKFKVALPTGDKTIMVQGKPMDRAALVAAEIAKYDGEIRTEATRRIDSQRMAAEAVAGGEIEI